MRNLYAKNRNISKIKGKKYFLIKFKNRFQQFAQKRKELYVGTNLPTNTNATYDLSIKLKIM